MRKNQYDNFCKISKLFPEQFNKNLIFLNDRMWGITLINYKLEYGMIYTNELFRATAFFKDPETLFDNTIKPLFVHIEQLTFYKHLKIKRAKTEQLIKVLTE